MLINTALARPAYPYGFAVVSTEFIGQLRCYDPLKDTTVWRSFFLSIFLCPGGHFKLKFAGYAR